MKRLLDTIITCSREKNGIYEFYPTILIDKEEMTDMCRVKSKLVTELSKEEKNL